jgi:HNH endonuclease
MNMWSKEIVIEKLKEASIDGVCSYKDAQANSMSLPTMARRLFGSFDEACKQAGLISKEKSRVKYSQCVVDNCEKATRGIFSKYCETHNSRIRRKGSFNLSVPDLVIDHSGGYNLILNDNHPLTTNGQKSRLYEHRVVFFNAYGYGPFKCHWCQCDIDWSVMDIDHIDDDKKNNKISNLVASCSLCNMKRGRWKMVKTMRSKGINITFNGETKHLSEWAECIGIDRQSLQWRLDRWDLSRALTENKHRVGRVKSL